MRILLLKGALDDRIASTYAFFLIKKLCLLHTIGVNFDLPKEAFFSPIINIPNLKKVSHSKWDIVIYFDSVIQSKALAVQSKILKLPSVFLSFSKKVVHQPIMTINPINRIVNCYKPNPKIQSKNYDSYAISCRRPTFIFNYLDKQLERENFDSFIHIITDEDYNLDIVRSIIPAVNRFQNSKLYIYGKHFEEVFLNVETLDNVFFEVYDPNKPINLNGNNIVIGSGQIIYECLLNNIPAIVVGERGFGGIMTKKMLKKHYLSDFRGRIGAELFETIPHSILQDEILTILSKLKNNEYESLSLRNEIENLQENSLDIVDIIENVATVNQQFVSPNFLKLIPKINPLVNIKFITDEQYVVFLNHNPAFIFGKNEHDIISKIDNTSNISNIIDCIILQGKCDKDEIYAFLKGLYGSNIIYLT